MSRAERFACGSGELWVNAIIRHGITCIRENAAALAWDDHVGLTYEIRCLHCESVFVLHMGALKADPSTRARILENGLSTTNGRETLMRTLLTTIARERVRHAKTAWERVLSDED